MQAVVVGGSGVVGAYDGAPRDMTGVVDAGAKGEIEGVSFAMRSPQSSRQEMHASRRAAQPGPRAQLVDDLAVLRASSHTDALGIRGHTCTCLHSGDGAPSAPAGGLT